MDDNCRPATGLERSASPRWRAGWSIPCLSRSVQAFQPLGDVEIGVVDGGDFVIVLLGGLGVAESFGDPAQPIVQGLKFSLSSASRAFKASW